MYEDITSCALYMRYSSVNQTEQSIEGQERVCKEFCAKNGFKIAATYVDRATSASKDIEKRVEFLKMIKDAEKHGFDAVVVYKLDRFSRSRYDMATYKYKLKRVGVQLISATENISDDPEGIILESVLEGMAEFYSAELAQKITRGLKESAYKHKSTGGVTPLGYKTVNKELVIDPETAPIVKEAFELYANGVSITEICKQFNSKGYKSSKGNRFNKNSFHNLLTNEKYIGVYKYDGYRAENAIPAIIDKETFEIVQKRFGTHKPSGTYKAKSLFLLSGKIFCGHCGYNMTAGSNHSRYRYYGCSGKKNFVTDCTKKNIKAQYIENVVLNDALTLLTDENIDLIADTAVRTNLNDVETTTNIPVIRGRLHETQISLDNLTRAIETGSAPETLVKRMMELEKEKKDLEAQLKKEERTITILDKDQVVFWLEQFKQGDIEDEDFCKMLIDLLVNSVTVWDGENEKESIITIVYNLTSLQKKTYRLKKDGTSVLSDLPPMEKHWILNPTIEDSLLIHTFTSTYNRTREKR